MTDDDTGKLDPHNEVPRIVAPPDLEDEMFDRLKAGDEGAAFDPKYLAMLRSRFRQPDRWEGSIRPQLKRHGIRITALEKHLKGDGWANGKGDGGSNGDTKPGQPLTWPEPAPWPHPVDLAALLEEIVDIISRYCVISVGGARAIALWVVAAHGIQAFDLFARLCISAATKECGKSTLLNIIMQLVQRPLPTSNITAAVLFRAIDAALRSGLPPTLGIDEFDNQATGDNPDLRAIVNSGHARAFAYVLRVVGDEMEPRKFSTWAPMVVAMIGRPWPTLESRSIVVEMVRKKSSETVDRWSEARPDDLMIELCATAARWATDHADELATADPQVPAKLKNRAADNWRPLLAVAELAGGEWPRLAREAALYLSGEDDDADDDDDPFVMFLADLKTVFDAEKEPDRVRSTTIIEKFNAMEDRPWPTYNRGKQFNAHNLGKLVRRVKPTTGRRIKSATVKFKHDEFGNPIQGVIASVAAKGFYRTDFEDAFARFLSTRPPPL
jgi:hypothetical protein